MYGATVGKAAILAEPAVTNQAVCGCTPFEGVTNKFLFTYLLSQRANFRVSSEGGAQPNISKVKIVNYPFPLPPTAEQKRIVAKVYELMALCDRLEAQLEERDTRRAALARAALARFAEAPSPDNLEFLFHDSFTIDPTDLRKTILMLALRGRLSEQEPADEPVGLLLERAEVEKGQLMRDGVLKRVDASPGDQGENVQFELPEGWSIVPLSKICTSITDGDHLPPPKTESGVPFLVISNVRWAGLDFSDTRFVSEEYFADLEPIRKPRKGDILYTLVGSLGIPVLVDVQRPFCVQRHIGILRPSSHMSLGFLMYALKSQFFFEQSCAIATGIAQKTIPLSGLRRVQVPLPPPSPNSTAS